jgi:hypothetical protein
MRRDLPSTFETRVISGSVSLTTHDVALKGLFLVAASGITVTLPTPQEALCGTECIVVNDSSGSITVSCANGFPHNLDAIALSAGASVLLVCIRSADGVYRWCSIGATAT